MGNETTIAYTCGARTVFAYNPRECPIGRKIDGVKFCDDNKPCDAEPVIAWPAAEAREFFKQAKFIAGLAIACEPEDVKTQEEFIETCDRYLALIPEEAEDGGNI